MASVESELVLQVSDPKAFDDYFTKVSSTRGDGLIGVNDFFLFFEGSNLPFETIATIWCLVTSGEISGMDTCYLIGRKQFYEALQLTSLTQEDKEILEVFVKNVYENEKYSYKEDLLPKLDLPNVPPPHIVCLPPNRDTKWLIVPENFDPSAGVIGVGSAMGSPDDQGYTSSEEYLYILPDGAEYCKPPNGFGCKNYCNHIKVHLPKTWSKIEDIRVTRPIDRDWLMWEDVPESVKAQIIPNLPPVPSTTTTPSKQQPSPQ